LKSREQAEDLDRSVKAAAAATQLGVRQYRTGVIDFNRVFNLETTQVQQQDQLAVAACNIALNLVNVYRALGGGWELRCQREQLQGTTDSEHGDARGAPLGRQPLAVRNRYQSRYRRLGPFLDPGPASVTPAPLA